MDGVISCRWDGEALRPIGNHSRAWAMEKLPRDEVLEVEIGRGRSQKSHNHQFAEIYEGWLNLPELLRDMPYARSPETLRKHALIATGFVNVETIVCGSKAAAERIAAYALAKETREHGYAIVEARRETVVIYSPHSQRKSLMGGKEFQRSKTMVLDWIAGLLDVRPEEIGGAT